MKCSVCAQDVPEDRYSEHLESEHGVTDDPTGVLIQHLTGLHSREGEGDGDEGLPDEEPSDADAFEEFLATHPAPPPEAEQEGEGEREEDEPAAEAPPTVESEGEKLTDKDATEFERMLATQPEVDLRKGRPQPPPETTEAPAEKTAAPVAAAAAGAAAATAAATGDRDEKTFAVWDEARGATEEDEDVLVVAPPAELEKARRRRQAALVGLGAAIILIAIAVIYLLTRDTTTKKTTATAPVTFTVPTTVAPTFLPGPEGGASTTVATVPPTTTAPASAPATPATTAAPSATVAPGVDPKSQITFPQVQGTCSNGQLSASGAYINNNPQTYTFSFTVTFFNSAGAVLGQGNGTVAHAPPHSRGPFAASGSCTDVNGAAGHREQITSITPG